MSSSSLSPNLTAPFNFPNLPPEIKHMVYEIYFSPWSLSLSWSAERTRLSLGPDYRLLNVSHEIHDSALQFWKQAFTGHLYIEGYETDEDISKLSWWLLSHSCILTKFANQITSLNLRGREVPCLDVLPLACLMPNLEILCINHPMNKAVRCTCASSDMMYGTGCSFEDILDGKRNTAFVLDELPASFPTDLPNALRIANERNIMIVKSREYWNDCTQTTHGHEGCSWRGVLRVGVEYFLEEGRAMARVVTCEHVEGGVKNIRIFDSARRRESDDGSVNLRFRR